MKKSFERLALTKFVNEGHTEYNEVTVNNFEKHNHGEIISSSPFINYKTCFMNQVDVLDVVRNDTYVTVDPEHPIVVLPKSIGRVKVISVQEKNAVVRVIKDNKKEPIQLRDVVIKSR